MKKVIVADRWKISMHLVGCRLMCDSGTFSARLTFVNLIFYSHPSSCSPIEFLVLLSISCSRFGLLPDFSVLQPISGPDFCARRAPSCLVRIQWPTQPTQGQPRRHPSARACRWHKRRPHPSQRGGASVHPDYP